ncbi:MAG: hypothetical protein C4288_06095 [Leptolyngbya sp. ERB_1_1]
MNIQEFLQRFETEASGARERVRDGEKLQHVLIGSPEGIHEVTHTLHVLRYADVSLWSPIVPMPGTSLSMSVLTRYRR